uniref:Histone acetyltransferase type B catalytic subunit n=2 Tax=Daphnia pulex TaxID=6669 RepID=A0A4Y7MTB7_DAPPU|nr:EOG090X06NC [Daphnia pulex]
MEGSYKKNVLQSFIIDSNEALDFKLVREPSDVDNDETTFKPEMSHQIFGENESIFGYQNLKISLYYTAGKLNTYLGMNYSKKVDPKQFEGATADDVMGAITPKLPPGYMTNLDDFLVTLNKEQSFKPPGELLSTYSINKGSAAEKNFELYSCTIEEPSFRSYHERLQTFLLWYVDAASFIDVDDDRWRFYLIFEKYPCDGSHRYALCGYATVYLYFAYPNKTRPRISQFLVLPPFQRVGLGAELLNTIYRSFLKDSNILDITVEDPSEEFTRLRDFVDAQNSKKLSSYSKEKLQQGFNAEMVEDAQRELKINKKQARRVYEILRFEATNLADVEEYRAYRLDVKRRLNIPYQKEASDYKKLQKALNAEELRSTLSTSTKEQRIENLDKQYQMLENEYRQRIEQLQQQLLQSQKNKVPEPVIIQRQLSDDCNAEIDTVSTTSIPSLAFTPPPTFTTTLIQKTPALASRPTPPIPVTTTTPPVTCEPSVNQPMVTGVLVVERLTEPEERNDREPTKDTNKWPWLLTQDLLQDGLRLLISGQEGHFHGGTLSGISPPEFYGVVDDVAGNLSAWAQPAAVRNTRLRLLESQVTLPPSGFRFQNPSDHSTPLRQYELY